MRFLTLVLLLALSGACGHPEIPADAVRPPILSITGEACPIREEDLFRTSTKDVFSECDLRSNPELFNGKTVRVRALYGFMIHGAYLTSASTCPGQSRSFHEAVSVGFRSTGDLDHLDRLLEKASLVDLTIIGLFSFVEPSKKSDTIYDNTPFRLEVICLEKAQAQIFEGK